MYITMKQRARRNIQLHLNELQNWALHNKLAQAADKRFSFIIYTRVDEPPYKSRCNYKWIIIYRAAKKKAAAGRNCWFLASYVYRAHASRGLLAPIYKYTRAGSALARQSKKATSAMKLRARARAAWCHIICDDDGSERERENGGRGRERFVSARVCAWIYIL